MKYRCPTFHLVWWLVVNNFKSNAKSSIRDQHRSSLGKHQRIVKSSTFHNAMSRWQTIVNYWNRSPRSHWSPILVNMVKMWSVKPPMLLWIDPWLPQWWLLWIVRFPLACLRWISSSRSTHCEDKFEADENVREQRLLVRVSGRSQTSHHWTRVSKSLACLHALHSSIGIALI